MFEHAVNNEKYISSVASRLIEAENELDVEREFFTSQLALFNSSVQQEDEIESEEEQEQG